MPKKQTTTEQEVKNTTSAKDSKNQPSEKPVNKTEKPSQDKDNTSGDPSANEKKELNLEQLREDISSDSIREDTTLFEALERLISEKKEKILVLQEAIKPINREERRHGKKQVISPAIRTSAKNVIKKLKTEIVSLEEDKRNVWERLKTHRDSEQVNLINKIQKEYSLSDYYLKRSKKRIISNIVNVLNRVRSESRGKIVALVEVAQRSGGKSATQFQEAFLEFLRLESYKLFLLCTGKEYFKKEISTKFRRALKTWDPRRTNLTLQ